LRKQVLVRDKEAKQKSKRGNQICRFFGQRCFEPERHEGGPHHDSFRSKRFILKIENVIQRVDGFSTTGPTPVRKDSRSPLLRGIHPILVE
jgi:hypothetical protein